MDVVELTLNARNECPAQSLSSGLPDAEIRNSQGEHAKSYRGGKRDGGKGKPRALSVSALGHRLPALSPFPTCRPGNQLSAGFARD